MLQSIMEMQRTQGEMLRTQGQLVEAVQSLRDGQREINSRVESISRRLDGTDDKVDALGQKVHTAQTVVWVVGAALAGTVGVVGWAITNAIAVLPSLLNAR